MKIITHNQRYLPHILNTKCYSDTIPQKFYQCTVIDEASRERFIYHYMEQSSYSTIDFIKRDITYSGYQPKIIQTDNGQERELILIIMKWENLLFTLILLLNN